MDNYETLVALCAERDRILMNINELEDYLKTPTTVNQLTVETTIEFLKMAATIVQQRIDRIDLSEPPAKKSFLKKLFRH